VPAGQGGELILTPDVALAGASEAGIAPAGASWFASTLDALPQSLESLREWAVPVWMLGIVLFSLRLLWAYGYVVSLRRRATVTDDATFAIASRLAGRMHVARPFRLMLTTLADGPSVIGWLRPVILLPSATLLGLTPLQLEAVLAHELAHIRRHDYLVNLFQSVVEILLFYHPAVWWVSNVMRRERELCCDDLAVAMSGDAVAYARALTVLERQRLAAPRPEPALAAAGGWLKLRVRRLVGLVHDPDKPTIFSMLLALSLALGILVVSAQSADSLAQENAPRSGAASAGAAPPTVDVELAQVQAALTELQARLAALEASGRRGVPLSPDLRAATPNADATLGYYLSVAQGSVTAAGLGGRAWADVDRVASATRAVDLSEAQRTGIDGVLQRYRANVTASAERVRSGEAELATLLNAEAVDRGAITTKMDTLIDSRAELDRETAGMALELRERMSLEQWTALNRQVQTLSMGMGLNGGAVTEGRRGGRGGGAGGRSGGPGPTGATPPATGATPPPAGATPTPQ
jgi:beta-lactamase regulating signal transducer with metallopeptidase domain